MVKDRCRSCGKSIKLKRGKLRHDEVGVPVLLTDVQISHCHESGKRELIVANCRRIMDAISFGVASQPWQLRGPDVRFLRKYLGLTGKAFGKLLQVESETLSRWENGKNSDRLICFVVLSRSPALRKRLEEFMNRFRELTNRPAPRGAHTERDATTLKYKYA